MNRFWAFLLLGLGIANLVWLNRSLYPRYQAQLAQEQAPHRSASKSSGAQARASLATLPPAMVIPFEGGAYMSRQSHQDLRLLALRLAERNSYWIELWGHSEPNLPKAQARVQSVERAQFVHDLLVQVGLDERRIEVRGVGSSEPRPGLNPQGAPLTQRRVELRVLELVSQ